jgi:uncharacterized protein YdeI (YjbR/CyaY-like superfamily)
MKKIKMSASKWKPELEELRGIVLECGLKQEAKWGWPCFTLENKNIVLIHAFKEYCALMFFKGVLLKDAKKILVAPSENMQSTRQIRFTSIPQVVKMKPIIKAYINEAIEVEKSGLKVKLKKTSEFKMPEEFKSKLNEMPALEAAFHALTPGRQRGYLLHIGGAKRSETRAARVEKSIPSILQGKGLMDE